MSVINKLSSTLNQKDESANIELAKNITATNDKNAIKELFENLHHKNKKIQSDCIKVIYEVAYEKPELIANYLKELIEILKSKNNRLQWGAMIAISSISKINPKEVYTNLSEILVASDNGSVISKDNFVRILINLSKDKYYHSDCLNLLNEELLKSPDNQLPMYAELILEVVDKDSKEMISKSLKSRVNDIEKDSKKKRVEKVIIKLNKI